MGTKIKVLVVDDDRRMVRTICDILTVKGYDPIPAYSGEEAVEKVGSEAPDSVLMDVRMPGIDGVETLKKIAEIAPDIPVVLMSAFATEAQAVEARKLGALSVLAKPVDIQMLLSFFTLLRKEQCILVVDDDHPFCMMITDILQARGYRVEVVSEPGFVLGSLEKDYKLAVIVDLKPGPVNGVDVLKDIRSRYPSKPVLLATGYREEMALLIESGLKIGAYACLYKPFEMDELIGIIEEISRKKLKVVLGEPFAGRGA